MSAASHATPASPLLEVDHLCVDFGTRHGPLRALSDVSFGIAPGEVLGMVGESGAGKSLTGAAITGLLPAAGRISGGRIVYDGERIDTLPDNAMRRLRGRQIGSIFQDPMTALNPLLTLGRQLVETLRAHLPLTEAEAQARAVSLLEETGIPGAAQRMGHYPHQLSGGMRQRVVMALALAAGPRLLIADEPTTALDVSVQAQVLALLKRLCRERGMAMLLVTHDMGVVAHTCDRVAVMYAGRIVEIGPAHDVLQRPAHPYTAGLMGAIPSMSGERDQLQQIDGAMPRLGQLPSGCAFHPRCPRAWAVCHQQRPELTLVGASRAACWLHEAEATR